MIVTRLQATVTGLKSFDTLLRDLRARAASNAEDHEAQWALE